MLRSLLLVFILALTGSPAPAQTKASLEVMHWWVSAGEAAAIAEVRAAFEKRGGTWVDLPSSGYPEVRQSAMERIVAGYPPAVMQWLAGPDLESLRELHLITETEPIADRDGWNDIMYPFVRQLAGRDGSFVALPVSIHGENWAWYNSNIYSSLGLTFPQSWPQFLRQAPQIQAAGYVPLAIGDEDWQLRILFSAILVGIAGPDAYRAILINKNTERLRDSAVRATFDTFRQLRAFVDAGHAGRTWNDATAMVADGRAAAQIMGDWAKGEFTAVGLMPGEGYECRLAPAATTAYITVVDMFLLGNMTDPETVAAQSTFAQTVVSPKVQIAFAKAKGSIPILKNLKDTARQLDACAALGVAALQDPEAFLPTVNLFDDGAYVASLSAAIRNIWIKPAMSTEEAIDHFADALTTDQ